MISNHVTHKQDLVDFEQKVLETKCSVTNWDETNHTLNELVKKFQRLCEGDKYNEHYVQIKKIAGELKELDANALKLRPVSMEKGFHLFENLLYDRESVLEEIGKAADEEIRKHIDFVVGEVVHEHTVDKVLFDSIRQYSDLISLPKNELNAIVFDTYIQKVADEALQSDYDPGSFDLFKEAILAKAKDLMKIHFMDGQDRTLFEEYLSKITDREWDNIIKTALL